MNTVLIIVGVIVVIGIAVFCTAWTIRKKGWFRRKKKELAQSAGNLAQQGADAVTKAVQDAARKVH
jgi:FtsZ-interacting cell division protein ZipA